MLYKFRWFTTYSMYRKNVMCVCFPFLTVDVFNKMFVGTREWRNGLAAITDKVIYWILKGKTFSYIYKNNIMVRPC